MSSKPLRIGTDCSGIEAPIQALQQLQIRHKHVWSSDIDKFVIKSIKANYEPEILFGDPDGPYPDGDITKRDNSLLPDIDLYVSGPPCQSFSVAGNKKGFKDKRGNVFWSCLDVIKLKKPKYFILENVKGILWNDKENKKDKYGRTWKIIWCALQELEKDGYYVRWKVLNTRHYGIPQNRERVFMVGRLDGDFYWPEPTEMDNIRDYVDWGDRTRLEPITEKRAQCLEGYRQDSVFVDIGFTRSRGPRNNVAEYCPTITCCGSWNFVLHRLSNVTELLTLQGFESFKRAVSTTQLKKQIGNSMSVNVVMAILNELLDPLYELDFPWRQYNSDTLMKEFTKVVAKLKGPVTLPITRSYVGYLCSNYFFQRERLSIRGISGSKLSPLEYWNTKRGKEIIMKNSSKNNRDIFNSVVFLSRAPAQFSIIAAGKIYNYFTATHILDPYAGWGDRCLAAMAMNISYTGIDSNPKLEKPFDEMVRHFSTSPNIKIIIDKAENVNLDSIKYDLIFSSPPFWKDDKLVECYENCQDNYDTFMKTSLIPIVRKGLANRVRVCLHLPTNMYDDLCKVFGQPTYSLIINKTTQTKLNKDCVYCW